MNLLPSIFRRPRNWTEPLCGDWIPGWLLVIFWMAALLGLLIGLLMMVTGCAEVPSGAPAYRGQAFHTKACVTFYKRGEDKWGSEVAMGSHAKGGVTIAAPKWLPFGTPVHIPALASLFGNGHFTVQDRGKWVETCRAARKRGLLDETGKPMLTLDVWCATRQLYAAATEALPPVLDVIIGE